MTLLSAYKMTLIALFAASAATFVLLMFVRAPYGRYSRKGWGPQIPAKIAWIVMEAPAVVVIFLFYLSAPEKTAPLSVFILLWQGHYLYRTFIYPLLMRGGKKGFPAVLIVMAMTFNSANGFVNGYYIFHLSGIYHATWLLDPRFLAGAFLFLWGMYVHIRSDHLLRTLRAPGETEYKIPHGGMYRFISAPNYFGETIQWCGWALATWSLPGLSFAAFTAANLIPRGLSHHKWYEKTFPDYPSKRKAVLPFIL